MCTFIHPEIGLRAHIVASASQLIGQAKYCYLSEECNPPATVNCVVMVSWVMAKHGISMPAVNAHLLDNLLRSGELITLGRPGDLIFVRASSRPHDHVGMLTFRGRVVHACAARGTVVEDDYEEFVDKSTDRPRMVSVLEKKIGLTPQDAEQYVRGKLPAAVAQIIEDHTSSQCFDCELLVQKAWQVEHPLEETAY